MKQVYMVADHHDFSCGEVVTVNELTAARLVRNKKGLMIGETLPNKSSSFSLLIKAFDKLFSFIDNSRIMYEGFLYGAFLLIGLIGAYGCYFYVPKAHFYNPPQEEEVGNYNEATLQNGLRDLTSLDRRAK
jgi:hypothetical protein